MKNKNYLGIGIALGAGIGAAIGVAMGNLAIGVGAGVGAGLAIGAGFSQKNKKEEDKKDMNDEWSLFKNSNKQKTVANNAYHPWLDLAKFEWSQLKKTIFNLKK